MTAKKTAQRLRSFLPDDAPTDLLFRLCERDASNAEAQRSYDAWRQAHDETVARQRVRGVAALTDSVPSASDDFMTLADAVVERDGCTRREACRRVAKSHPEAYQAFVAGCPPAGR